MNSTISGEESQAVAQVTIGSQLKEARLKRRLTLLEVSDVIHLKVSYLEALERDDYSRMPVAIYTKNYIMKYANYLGLDGKGLSERFYSQEGDRGSFVAMADSVKASGGFQSRPADEESVMPRHWFLFAIVVLGIIVALVKVGGKLRASQESAKSPVAQAQSQAKLTPLQEEQMVIRQAPQKFDFAEKLPENN